MAFPDGKVITSLHGPYGLLRRLSEENLDDIIHDTLEETRELIEHEIVARAPELTGNLKASIRVELTVEADGRYRLTAHAPDLTNEFGERTPYDLYVEEGTGIWGPRRKPITPVRAPYLRFFWHRMNRPMKLKEVQGQMPNPFFRPGWRQGMRIMRRRLRERLQELEIAD